MERGGREGLKEKEGWRLQRSSRHGRCRLQHSLSLFPPRQQEAECEAGLQLAVSCSQFTAAPGEERKSLLMSRDVERQGKLPCYCTLETLSPKSLIMIGPVRFLRLFYKQLETKDRSVQPANKSRTVCKAKRQSNQLNDLLTNMSILKGIGPTI